MVRHPVLHKLTEDHHHTLVQARHLREATEQSARGRSNAFLSRWRREVQPHFAEEEQALLPFICPPLDPRLPVFAEMLAQHAEIRRLVLDLQRAHHAEDDPARLAAAHRLGEALDAHVRLEEQQVFETIQAGLSAEQLTRLGEWLAAWEGAGVGSRE